MNLVEMSELLGIRFTGENQLISNLAYDSRDVKDGGVFFAIRGQDQDGHDYIEKAIENGAIAVVGEKDLTLSIPYFQVFNTKKALAVISNEYYETPSKDINLVGVIGTNGKTTITYLIQHVFECLGINSGLIGTNGSWVGSKKKATHTTPMSLDLNYLLKDSVKNNLQYLVMEVSSHGIKENRVDQIHFDRLIFTNITPEHLDYHKTFEDYLFTKMRPFVQMNDYQDHRMAIINCDDEHSDYFIGVTNGRILTYGCRSQADFYAEDIVYAIDHTTFLLYVKGEFVKRVKIPLFGKYNVYNVLSVIGYFYSLGYPVLEIIPFIENVSSVEGRFEYVQTKNGVTIVIDYAHNPDAIFQVLTNLNVISQGEIITVLGAGGNRDKAKRKIMGNHASTLSDYVFFTSDNPRNEDPLSIIYDLLSGTTHRNYTVIVDRKQAIEAAIEKAKPNDLVVILGKGHEKTQNINGKVVPFNDKIVVEEVIRKRGI